MSEFATGITLTGDRPQGPYPPKGFLPIAEGQLGNGDCFGLYWPFGKETNRPLVIEMQHDAWFMAPSFSSTDTFVAKSQNLTDDEMYVLPPTIEEDERSPAALYAQAEAGWKRGELDKCEISIRRAVEVLPEFTLAWERLFHVKRRTGDTQGATTAAISAVTSLAAFGRPSDQLLNWIRNIPSDVAERYSRDPIVQRRKAFTFRHGGTKTNEDYILWKECIEDYLSQGESLKAILVHQNYGFWMCAETVSFQAREGFTKDRFIADQQALFSRHLRHNRDFSCGATSLTPRD